LLVAQVTHHRIGLAGASLTVSEDGAVVALQNFLGEVATSGVIDGGLRGLWGEDVIERECFAIFSLRVYVAHSYLLLALVCRHEVRRPCVKLRLPFPSFSLKGRTLTNTLMHYSGI